MILTPVIANSQKTAELSELTDKAQALALRRVLDSFGEVSNGSEFEQLGSIREGAQEDGKSGEGVDGHLSES